MPTISISDQTYRGLQSLARPFEETEPEHVISRLVREASEPSAGNPTSRVVSRPANARPLSSHAGSIPDGAELKAMYKGQEFRARVVDGRIEWNGRFFDSISAAAVAVIQSTGSRRPTENGWRFWEVKENGGGWRPGTSYQTNA